MNSVDQHSDEIDLKELILALWKGKFTIISSTFLCVIISVIIALIVPNQYQSTAIVKPASDGSGNKLSGLVGQFGGLASLAGVNLSGNDYSNEVIAIEIMKTWGFAEDFIKRHKIEADVFAAEGWNASTNQVMYDSSIYEPSSKKWVRNTSKGKDVVPSSWELYEKFIEKVSIHRDKENGLVHVSVTHYSPEIAKMWVDWLIRDINALMKDRALKEANESIKYLEEQMATTSVAEIRNVFSQLIQEQHKTKMLAQVSSEFTFNTISEAKVPEIKSEPKRAFIVILGVFLGVLLGTLLVIIRSFIRNNSKEK